MKPCDPYLYEFLYRGRAPGDDTPAGWHVQIETRVAVGGGHVVPHVRTLNIEQATKEGWDLKKIAGTINIDALDEIEQLRKRLVDLELDKEDLTTSLDAAQADAKSYKAMVEHLQIVAQEIDLSNIALQHDRDQALREIQRLVAVVDEQTAVVKVLRAKEPRPAPARRRSPTRPHA